MYNQQRALREQDRAAAAGILRQQELQRQANARLQQQLADLEQSSPQDERAVSQAQFLEQLRRTRAAREATLMPLAGASERFAQDLTAGMAENEARAQRIAELMASVDAPVMQRRAESEQFGRLATDIGQIGRASRGEDFLTRLRMSAIRPNPWIQMGAQMGQSYANYLATRPGLDPILRDPGALASQTNAAVAETIGAPELLRPSMPKPYGGPYTWLTGGRRG